MENSNIKNSSVEQGLLDVSGATLYYETKGGGPLLLMIPGANGDHFIFTPIREALSKHFTVVTYDRRGFSRSKLTAPQDYSRRIDTDADDAVILIKHLTNEPATVFGTSSGALVSLQLLTLHAGVIKTIVAHEPTALKVLPDGEKWNAFNQELYDIYSTQGPEAAMQKFAAFVIPGSKDGEIMKQSKGAQNPNIAYWFEHELCQYPVTDFNIEILAQQKEKLIFAVGRESTGMLPSEPNILLAEQFGSKILSLPGGHLGYLLHPAEFVNDLINGLRERGV